MKLKKYFAIVMSALMAVPMLLGLWACEKTSDRIELYFDGGGSSGNYTTTRDYNTLEVLAEEWNEKNDTYKVVINKASISTNGALINSMLEGGTGPDMLMQVPTIVNDHIGNGWYVELNDYLEKPNPYQEGNIAWKDIWGADAIKANEASDGINYYVCLDNIAIGMMYNMDVLSAAGIAEAPQTYSDFLTCLAKLKAAKKAGIISADIYVPTGLWHEIYLSSSVYGDAFRDWDEDKSGGISTYEAVKAYKSGKWTLSDPEFQEFLRLCYAKAAYYPDNYLGYDVMQNFAKGKLAITDAIGNGMRILSKNAKFDIKITGYPILDEKASAYGKHIGIRGSAGLGTSYWITNSAINKGQEAVDACVDFLMFLSATENNARFVNDRGYALPIDVSKSTIDTYRGLAEEYVADLANVNALKWGSCFLPLSVGIEFYDFYQMAMGNLYQDSDGVLTGNTNAVIDALKPKLQPSIDNIYNKYGWTF